MNKKTKGAWLLTQSKSLDAVAGSGPARLENIAYAGRVGRLYNLLRRNVANDPNPIVSADELKTVCQLNAIDRPTREHGLKVLKDAGRLDLSKNGSVVVLGATGAAVLEVTSDIFEQSEPTYEEQAVLELSDKIADRPLARSDAIEFVGDLFSISTSDAMSLIDLCKSTAIIDEETDRDRSILFNSNTFRDGEYARKALLVLEGLTATDRSRLSEVEAQLHANGALYEDRVKAVLGPELYSRLISVGLYDRMEVSNSTEAVGYVTSPNDFQKYGRPFEDDPIDDAKALLASLTYGQTRSSYTRGSITMPVQLLEALISGREIGKNGVKAIGEDYKELEARQVVKVADRGDERYTMTLLKKDVGELALTIVRGGTAAQEAILMDGSPATAFKGPHEVRTKNSFTDRRFVADALDRLRSGA